MFEKSIIVAAHPDDEVLWFSSILDKVNKVIIYSLGMNSDPTCGIDRQKSLIEHPIKNISWLDIGYSGTFYGVYWEKPKITKYGIDISDKTISDKTYKENYYKLKEQLENKLAGYCNVFTHNPWGEYGHPEHIQVYRVVKDLQDKLKFDLWFSNYVSNKSFKLMVDCIYEFNFEYVTFKTNKVLANDSKHLYKKNNCWTWYDDWEWFNEESFMKGDISERRNIKFGKIIPLNFIKVRYPEKYKSRFDKYKSRTYQILRYLKTLQCFLREKYVKEKQRIRFII